MHITEIWRYPIKSLAGERLDRGHIADGGIAGDRIIHVEDRCGRLITARTHPRLLGMHATLGPAGEPLIDGRPLEDGASVVSTASGAAPTPRTA